ncbi:MAG: quinol:cytochrome C oxidoreductase [Verrucomicrobia bacterium]|nr:quinol:cytochrome C oxidoreductase [Verrucomicrobiota bacterium]MBV9656792.1 quinol:cytochrome C oxidoreductase [Verrucomicrobiota bacterium]
MSAATAKADPQPQTTAAPVEHFQFTNLGPLLFGLLVSGGAALVICLLLALFGTHALRERLLFSWLYAFAICFTVAAGSVFWVLVHHATDAEWSVVVRRILETVGTTFFYLWVFFLPVLFFAPTLYEWLDPAVFNADPVLVGKRALLNRPFWGFRAVFILAFFAILAWLLRYFSTRQDATGDPRWTVKLRQVTYPCLPLFALCLTFGAVDWFMSLNPHWYSTMWGVYVFAGSAWCAMAVLILITYALQRAGYLEGIATVEHYHIMGKLLLSFTVFWAYIGFGQYFLIWYANIPEEAEYFVARNTEGWNVLSTALVVCHFFIPFLALCSRINKRVPQRLAIISIWCVLIHLLDLYIIVIPAAGTEKAGPTLLSFFLALICLVAIAAPLAFLFLRNLAKTALYPLRDPRIVKSLKLVN